MKLNFTKPIAFFDVESTGLSISEDKIVSICILKVFPDGTREIKKKLINPEKPIPKEVSEIHGITDDMVKNEPTFRQLAKGIASFLDGCDLAGYNSNNYDIPILVEHFLSCGVDFPSEGTKFIDVGNLFKKKEERTLSAAMKFYCGKELEGAHDAENDVIATYEVFKAQLEKYDDLTGKDIDFVSEFTEMGKRVDFAGKIGIDADGDYVYNFGKDRGKKIKHDTGLALWCLDKDFPLDTKRKFEKVLNEIRKELYPEQENDGLPF